MPTMLFLILAALETHTTLHQNPTQIYSIWNTSSLLEELQEKLSMMATTLMHITPAFYKHILNLPITYHDMELEDYEYFNSLKWILENSPI